MATQHWLRTTPVLPIVQRDPWIIPFLMTTLRESSCHSFQILMSNKASFDENGKLLSDPVMLKVDAGQGQIVSDKESIQKRISSRNKFNGTTKCNHCTTGDERSVQAILVSSLCTWVIQVSNLCAWRSCCNGEVQGKGLGKAEGRGYERVLLLTIEDLSSVLNGEEMTAWN